MDRLAEPFLVKAVHLASSGAQGVLPTVIFIVYRLRLYPRA